MNKKVTQMAAHGGSIGRRASGSALLIAAALVVCTSANAGPIPSSTLRNAAAGLFTIGVGINDSIPQRPQDWPLLLSQFNCVTPENCLKPDAVQLAEGDFRFTPSDAFVEFASS